jgi:hypothetical protein
MNKLISMIALTATAVVVNQSSALAGGVGNNTIGPSVILGNGDSVFGINGKFGVADNVSIRPYVNFPSGGTNLGASVTYDWNLSRTGNSIQPFAGVGLNVASGGNQSTTNGFLQAGADFNVNESIALLAAVNVPLSNQNNGTSVTLGAGLHF